MARYKTIDTSPRFIAVDLERQLLPGTFFVREWIHMHDSQIWVLLSGRLKLPTFSMKWIEIGSDIADPRKNQEIWWGWPWVPWLAAQHKVFTKAICSGVLQLISSSPGLATMTASVRAREMATFRRLRWNRNSMLRGMSLASEGYPTVSIIFDDFTHTGSAKYCLCIVLYEPYPERIVLNFAIFE